MTTLGARDLAVRIVCMLVLLLGLAPEASLAAKSDDAAQSAYRLPDGSLASICQSGADERAPGNGRCRHCIVCIVGAGPAILGPYDAFNLLASPYKFIRIVWTSSREDRRGPQSHFVMTRGPPKAIAG